MLTWILYATTIYIFWLVISRCALLGAFVYSKPGRLSIRHYLLGFVGLCPFLLEIISTILICFSLAFGISPDPQKREVI